MSKIISLPQRSSGENVLTPITLTGVVVPWSKHLSGRRDSEFKLSCLSGAEYFMVAEGEWKDVLSRYRWEEVKVVGLLNLSDMTLIPQKVFPKGPRGEMQSTVDLATWKARDLLKKAAKNANELIFIPAAVLAVMAM